MNLEDFGYGEDATDIEIALFWISHIKYPCGKNDIERSKTALSSVLKCKHIVIPILEDSYAKKLLQKSIESYYLKNLS